MAHCSRDLRRSRAAVTVVFACLGALTTSLGPRVPAVQHRLHLSAPTLGLALLGAAAGLVAAAPVAGALTHRVRPRVLIAAGVVLSAVALPFVAVAGSSPALSAVLFAWGFGGGLIDVSMNVDAVAVETVFGRPIMAGFHGSFSVGALVGSGLGAVAAATRVGVGTHLVIASAVIGPAVLAAVALEPVVPGPVEHHGERRRLPPRTPALAALAAVALGSFLAEGGVNDWAAVYLRSGTATVAGFGYATFAVTMTAGRLLGDRMVAAVGARRLVRWSAALGGSGFGAALLVGDQVGSLVGFALLGVGLANVVPSVFGSAARLGAAGPSLAVVTASGYVGLMVGPALIGIVAGWVGLAAAFGTFVVACALASGLSGYLVDRPTSLAEAVAR